MRCLASFPMLRPLAASPSGSGRFVFGRFVFGTLTLGLIMLVVSGCSDGSDQSEDNNSDSSAGTTNEAQASASLLATTSIWADVTTQLTCGQVEVGSLIPAGADPHSFEPALADRASIDKADLIVANGLGLEGGLGPVLEGSSAPVVWLGGQVDVASNDGGDEQPDPHIWMDPEVVMNAIPTIAKAMNEAEIADPDTIARCSADYLDKLEQLDADTAASIGSIPEDDRNIVTGHRALTPFAERYGLDVVATVLASVDSLHESTPAHLSDVVKTIQDDDVQGIFVDEFQYSPDVDAVAREAGGVPVIGLYLESLGGPDTGASSYLDLISTDAALIVGALT